MALSTDSRIFPAKGYRLRPCRRDSFFPDEGCVSRCRSSLSSSAMISTGSSILPVSRTTSSSRSMPMKCSAMTRASGVITSFVPRFSTRRWATSSRQHRFHAADHQAVDPVEICFLPIAGDGIGNILLGALSRSCSGATSSISPLSSRIATSSSVKGFSRE